MLGGLWTTCGRRDINRGRRERRVCVGRRGGGGQQDEARREQANNQATAPNRERSTEHKQTKTGQHTQQDETAPLSPYRNQTQKKKEKNQRLGQGERTGGSRGRTRQLERNGTQKCTLWERARVPKKTSRLNQPATATVEGTQPPEAAVHHEEFQPKAQRTSTFHAAGGLRHCP